MMNRRAFLTRAAAAPLIFGLQELHAQDASPGWYEAALKRMKESRREGVAWVLPESPAERLALGKGLCRILLHGGGAAHQLLCEAVFIFVPSDLARVHLRKDARAGDRFLLDAGGAVQSADRYDVSLFNETSKFGESCALLLHGRDHARLRDRAESLRKGLPEDVRAAFAQLNDDDPDARSAAGVLLERHAERIIPCLVWISISGATVEERGRAGDLVAAYFRRFEEKAPGPRLPYGVEYPQWIGGGCGHKVEKLPAGAPGAEDQGKPSPPCGMAVASLPRAHTFVTFLSR